jgi:cystathionine beta-lyase
MKDHSLEVHGCHTYDVTGAISPSICLSATFRHPHFGESTGYDYGRVANPTRESLEKTMALLKRTGLDDKLLRLFVGSEDVEDLKADLQQALQG